jgi:hypothetical protein
VIWAHYSLVEHATVNDPEHLLMVDYAGLFHALARWLWP